MSENGNSSQEFAPKPKEGEPWDVAIIGSGPAGFTASIYTTRGAASTIIFTGEVWGGQLMLTTTVDNYPALPGIQGPDLMQKMREHATMFGGELVEKNVTGVDFSKSPFELSVGEEKYSAKSVIIATGAETKWLEVSGEDKLRGRGVSSCAPCDAPFFKEKKVVVVGGGDSAMEEALVLTKYATSVTIIHRRGEFKASAAMQAKVFDKEKEGKIDILWDTEVVEMIGEEKLERIKLKTNSGSEQAKKLPSYAKAAVREEEGYLYWEMPTEGLFVAVGHVPATEMFKEKIELDKKSYVKKQPPKNGFKMATSVPGVFVAGDVHDWHYRQAITAAGFGCQAGMDALKFLDKTGPVW